MCLLCGRAGSSGLQGQGLKLWGVSLAPTPVVGLCKHFQKVLLEDRDGFEPFSALAAQCSCIFSERFGDPNGVLLGQVLLCPSGGLGGSKVKMWSLLQLRAGLLCWL